jgi:long-chain fatty acid transport protein
MEKSMGGAVTAAPMDAMSAISNPAGIARVGKRADFSMELFLPKREANFSAFGGQTEQGGTDMYGIPAIGWTAPAFDRDDMWFGGGMYGTSGMGVDYGEMTMMPSANLTGMLGGIGMNCADASGTPTACRDMAFDGYSLIQFWKMAPTVAWDVNTDLTLGFALNLDYQSLTFTQRINGVPFINPFGTAPTDVYQMDINFDIGRPTSQLGYGATLGALYDVSEMITVGFSYSSKQSFGDAEFRVGTGDIMNYNGAVGAPGTYKMGLDFPQQVNLGVSVKPTSNLLVAADLKWINWSDTHDKVSFSGPANSFDTNGDGVGDASSTTLNFGWDDQTVIALGMQYRVSEALAVRAGYNYAKSPIGEEDVFNNLVFPAVVEQHIAVGADYKLGTNWAIAATYMKAFSNEITGKGDVPAGMQNPVTVFGADSGAKISLEESSLGFQLTYYMD